MLKGNFKNLSPVVKIFVIICVLIISLIVINIIGFIIAIPVFKIGFFNILNLMTHKDYNNHLTVNIFKYLQIWQTIGLFLIPPIILGYLFSDNLFDYLRLNKRTSFISLLLALMIVYTSMPLIEWMLDMNSKLVLPHQLKSLETWMKSAEDEAAVITKAFLNVTTTRGLFLNAFMIALLPAIGEEFLFRGLFVRFFKDWTKSTHTAVWLSAIIFSLIHFQFYGFVPRMMLGVLLGYLFVWSGTIWVPVFAHFINNGTAVISSYLFSKSIIKTDMDKMISDQSGITLLLLSIVSVTVFIYLFYNWEKKRIKPINQPQEQVNS